MEGDRKSEERRCQRCYECSRVEEELWALAYERVWPLARRPIETQEHAEPTASEPSAAVAKGA